MRAITAAAAIAACVDVSEAVRSAAQSVQAYEAFRREFGIERSQHDATSYMQRAALFQQRAEEAERHNAQPGVSWKAAVNKFSDYTPSEFNALLGHRPLARDGQPRRLASASFLELKPRAPLAAAVDWSMKLSSNISKLAKDQGTCGSCWAVASAGALETHAEAAHGSQLAVSYEQLVDCTPNPQECGGRGGCGGATAELAFQYVKEHGIVAQKNYKGYETGSGEGECKPVSSPALTTTGFVRLEVNKMQPLMEALSTHGPVVVSADAGGWGAYSSGVFDSCKKDAIINHAILAMGYGTDAGLKKDYWLIRNSWGPKWGEHGYIRLLRHSEEDAYCGTDNKPLVGNGCKGGAATLPVCGMCGILVDSAYPTGVKVV